MKDRGFHGKKFDDGTNTKLDLFELYLRQWLPVFLASERPPKKEIHVFDFFAGPGRSGTGEPGSPLRILRQLQEFRNHRGWSHVNIYVHLFDADSGLIKTLQSAIEAMRPISPNVKLDIRVLPFAQALLECEVVLRQSTAAKLLFIDQFGVDKVTEEVFRQIVSFPTSDFLFFLSSSTLHRFRELRAIKQKIVSPEDSYQVHRAAFEFYRARLPDPTFFLAPFSIKKKSNIYGLIFGSAHPLGIDKFLEVAWKVDALNGEANFDINRDHLSTSQPAFPSLELRPNKITVFESDLDRALRTGDLADEWQISRFCFEHGMRRQHAAPVLAKLRREGILDLTFRVPSIELAKEPRPVRLLR